VVRFDGASDFMSFVVPMNGLTGATLILVASAAQDYTGDWNGTANAPLFWDETAYWGCVHLSPFQSSVKYRFGTTQTNNLPAFARPVSIGAGLSITTAVKNGTTESLFVNGSKVLTQSGKYSTINSIAGTGTLGRGYNSTYFAGDIAEVLVYRRALSDAERAQIESYLISKYIAPPPPTNQAPSVSVGPAATVTYPVAASLTGTASDDGLPKNTLTYAWTKVSGPGDVTFSSPNAVNTSATFSAAGQYGLRLTVSDSQLTASADVQVTSVAPAQSSAVPTSGLEMWLRSDQGATGGNGSVSQWADQSGKQRTATQGNLANQPALVANCSGSSPCVRFNGTNSFLGFTLPVNGSPGMTIVMASAARADVDGAWNGSANSAIYWDESISWSGVMLSPFERVVKYRFGTGQVNNLPAYTRPATIGTQLTVTASWKNGANEGLYVDGQQVNTGSGKLSPITGVVDQGWLGRGYSNTYFTGDLFEVLVYCRALSTSELQAVQNYLLTKYQSTAPPVQPPAPVQNTMTVSAGADQTLAQPGTATLNGTAVESGTPAGPISYTWSMVSGPASVTFSAPKALATSATFTTAGTYKLQLTATDGVTSGSATCNITVNTAPAPPPVTSSGDVVYPSGTAGIYNVRDYGAKGDGVTDDTAAIRAAMAAAFGRGSRYNTIYLPNGTYVVSDTLWWAEMGTTPAQVTASVDPSRGCITGFTVLNGGSGYRGTWVSPNVGAILIYGGGGTGASASVNLSNGSVQSISARNGCTGIGYKSAPTVKVVNWRAWTRMQGQNRNNTIIRLKDNTFTNSNCSVGMSDNVARENCRAVLHAASEMEFTNLGGGEAAYYTDIEDLTVDTGNGNAGAIGIDWIGSNVAVVRNVSIRGTGRAGLNLSRNWNGAGGGPGLVKNVSVNGFDYCVYNFHGSSSYTNSSYEVGYTMEHLACSQQAVYGVYNVNITLTIRDLQSTNAVPAVVNQEAGNLTLIDSNLSGGNSAYGAILNQGNGRIGQLFARNIVTSGYKSAIQQGSGTGTSAGAAVTGSAVSEFLSSGMTSLFPSAATSLNLPIKETPTFVDNNLSDWAIVTNYGAQPNNGSDATAGIQAALNSGKPVIYLPGGTYRISQTLHIPSTVRKIFSSFANIYAGSKNTTWSAFSCEATSGPGVILQKIAFDIGTMLHNPTISSSCKVPFAMVDVFDAVGFANVPGVGTGDVFFENAAVTPHHVFTGINVWARQYDTEGGGTFVEVNGGAVWVLGRKTEGDPSSGLGYSYVHGGGLYESLGTFHSIHTNLAGPAYTIDGGSISLGGMAIYPSFSTVIRETRNGTTKTLGNQGNWMGGTGFTLYSGRP
jgi:hypothetical protein